jgi:hypothetical protein
MHRTFQSLEMGSVFMMVDDVRAALEEKADRVKILVKMNEGGAREFTDAGTITSMKNGFIKVQPMCEIILAGLGDASRDTKRYDLYNIQANGLKISKALGDPVR